MGSGTTLVACAKLGRKGIGIELDPDYFIETAEILFKLIVEVYEKTGIKIGKKAIVSSAKPKVVPPAATRVVTKTIRIYS